MQSWIASGQIGAAIVALTALEFCALAVYRRRFGGGISWKDSLPNILAGDFLLLAWWSSRGHWLWSVLCLLAALLSHIADMCRRWGAAGTICKRMNIPLVDK
jgi:hypothetical protein